MVEISKQIEKERMEDEQRKVEDAKPETKTAETKPEIKTAEPMTKANIPMPIDKDKPNSIKLVDAYIIEPDTFKAILKIMYGAPSGVTGGLYPFLEKMRPVKVNLVNMGKK